MSVVSRARDSFGIRNRRNVCNEPEMEENATLAASAPAPWLWTNPLMRNKDWDTVCRGAFALRQATFDQ